MTTETVARKADRAVDPLKGPDNRYKILESTMRRYQHRSDGLIEVLHHAQQLWGFLDDDLLLYVARKLKVPPSRVFGVATFYHFFSLKPSGKHTCIVCLGTACYVKGGKEIAELAAQAAGIKMGETTPEAELSLMSARCLGACGIAPVVVFDGVVAGRLTPEGVTTKIEEWLKNGSE